MESILEGADPNTTPLVPNPDGSPPNFSNPQTLTATRVGLGTALAVQATILVAIRITTNARLPRGLRADDGKDEVGNPLSTSLSHDFSILHCGLGLGRCFPCDGVVQ